MLNNSTVLLISVTEFLRILEFFFKSDVPFYSLFLYRMFKLGFYVLEHSKHSFYSLYLINPVPEASIYLFPLSVVSADHGL